MKIYSFRWNHNLFFGLISLLLCVTSAVFLVVIELNVELILLSIMLLSIGLTGLVFHLYYFLFDYGKYLEINYPENKLVISSKFQRIALKFDDISEIHRRTGKRLPGSYGGMVFHQYHHTCIIMKDGRRFIYTDFLNSEKLQIQVKYVIQFRLFNFLN